MGKIKVTETNLTDVKIIEPAVFGDHRGFFTESFSVEDFKAAGIDLILFKTIIHFQHNQVCCEACTFKRENQPKRN